MASRIDPRRLILVGAVSLVFTLVLTPIVSGAAPSSNWAQKKALRRAQAALAGARRDRKASTEAWKSEERRLDGEIAKLEKDLEKLRGSEALRERERDALRDHIESLYQKSDTLSRMVRDDRDRRKAVGELLLRQARALRDRIGLAPPHASRADRARRLDGLLSDQARAPKKLDRHFKALVAALREELGVYGTTELFRAQIPDERGIIRDCDVLRLGLSMAVFRARDGGARGVMVRGHEEGASTGWIRNLGWMQRRHIEGVFDGARRGQAGLVRFPVDPSLRMTVRAAPKRQSLIQTLARGGPVMIPLLLLALTAVVLVIRKWWRLRQEARGGARTAKRLVALAAEKQWDVAEVELGGGTNLISAMGRGGLARRGEGQAIVEEAMESAVLRALPALESTMRGVSVLAAVAPLLGLLGTVTGMISTFDVITLHGTGDPRVLAGGISEALITTETGLIIAIPLLLAHRYLRGRIDRIVARAQEVAFQITPHLAAGVVEEAE